MENLFPTSLTLEQWFYLFVLAMGVLVICSFASMISIWSVSVKLSDIKDKLDKIISQKENSEKS